jgi:hypothetical protein
MKGTDMQEITIDPKYTKTYKTKETLYKALEKLNLPDEVRYLLCEVNNRVTAVFINPGIHLAHVIHNGFLVVG